MIDMLHGASTYCVLDEADRMFDMGFEPQVSCRKLSFKLNVIL